MSDYLESIQTEASTIQELFANWEDDGIRQAELDWGLPQGKELGNS